MRLHVRVWLGVAILLCCARASSAQTCTPQKLETLAWGAAGQSIVPAGLDVNHQGDQSNFVPAGEVWLYEAAGIGTGVYSGPGLEYMMQIERKMYDANGSPAGIWAVPLHRNQASIASTPVLALTRPVVLREGERLSGRVSAPPSNLQIFVMGTGWRFPASCLERLLLRAP